MAANALSPFSCTPEACLDNRRGGEAWARIGKRWVGGNTIAAELYNTNEQHITKPKRTRGLGVSDDLLQDVLQLGTLALQGKGQEQGSRCKVKHAHDAQTAWLTE